MNQRCTATSKRSGEPCRRYSAPGRQVCYFHGGNSPIGIASGTFKSGRYSKVLPAGLLEKYREAISDPNLLELREDVAALDARLLTLLARVTEGGSGGVWKKLSEAWERMEEARARGRTDLVALQLGRIRALISEGDRDREAWAEIRGLWQERRKLVESENKRLLDQRQVMTTEQAMAMVAALSDSVKRHVSDPAALRAISGDLIRLVGRVGGDAPIPLRANGNGVSR